MGINFFREAPPSAVLDLQISLDFGSSYQDGPATDFTPINDGMGARSYDLRALGVGTEGISAISSNPLFVANLGDSDIIGNNPVNTTLFVAYNSPSPSESSIITISCSGGDSVILNVTGQSF
jgi:hypothetical protein